MKLYTLKREQFIMSDRESVFSFFKLPENLEKITPSEVGFVILTPKPIKMHIGTVLDYTINLFGFKVRWTTLISEYDEPYGFIDIATKSPYSFWHHQHSFQETAEGTIMTDEVTYALPFGFLGRIIHNLWVKKRLEFIFDYRQKIIDSIYKKNTE